jgi:hypothetical protein
MVKAFVSSAIRKFSTTKSTKETKGDVVAEQFF